MIQKVVRLACNRSRQMTTDAEAGGLIYRSFWIWFKISVSSGLPPLCLLWLLCLLYHLSFLTLIRSRVACAALGRRIVRLHQQGACCKASRSCRRWPCLMSTWPCCLQRQITSAIELATIEVIYLFTGASCLANSALWAQLRTSAYEDKAL